MTAMEVANSPSGAALAEQVVIKGDLSKLSEADRMQYYTAVCDSLGLNPLTRPFEYINLNNKLTLYATRAAGDQLRAIRGITITSLKPEQIGDLYVVTATGRDRTGREDSSIGAVSVTGLRGDPLANAMMKCETKAKRRLTLSLAGLGWTDETEIDSIPGAQPVEPPKSLAEKVAEKAAAVQAFEDGHTFQPMPVEVSESLPVEEAGEQDASSFETAAPSGVAGDADLPIPEPANFTDAAVEAVQRPKAKGTTTAKQTTPTTESETADQQCPSISKLSGERCRQYIGHSSPLHRTDNEAWTSADAR